MSDYDEMARLPEGGAVCPGCGVMLTPENVFRRQSGVAEGPVIVETDVPGVIEEHTDIPIFTLACVTCVLENRTW